jgi:hypothetical protein
MVLCGEVFSAYVARAALIVVSMSVPQVDG